MATIHDLIEVTAISAHTTYAVANGNLLGVIDNVVSTDLNDGEFDTGDFMSIGGVVDRNDLIQKPDISRRFVLTDGSQKSCDPKSEGNLDVVFLSMSRGADIRHFIIPNDHYGDMNIDWIETDDIRNAAGNDAAIISTANNDVKVICFASSTLIRGADNMPVPVEDLVAGDYVKTMDHGLMPVTWVGKKTTDARTIRAMPAIRPIRLEPGSLGPSLNGPCCFLPSTGCWCAQRSRNGCSAKRRSLLPQNT